MFKKLAKRFGVYLVIILIFVIWSNNIITVTEINIENSKIPESFNGYRIVQLSDVHNKNFGRDQSYITKKVNELKPDIIVVTGDLLDSYSTKEDIALRLMEEMVKIAPVYFVSGNHEDRISQYSYFKEDMVSLGVNILDNRKIYIRNGEAEIELLGVEDNASSYYDIGNLAGIDSNYKILLSHKPHLLERYANSGVDLVFSGHAHGGQFRVPFIGGIYSPGQGLFPEYTEGTYEKDNTTMIVSRGLGNSAFPIRIFNRPEIVLAILNK